MFKIYKNIKKLNKKSIKQCIALLRKNNLVSLPTETVYGLAANAYSEKAVKKIYLLKKRPKKNPLIVHYSKLAELKKDVFINNDFNKLFKIFSPGPITYVLKKRSNSNIAKSVSAGLDTIAIRFPSNKIVRAIMQKISFPLAMPSANISSKVTATSAESVSKEFKNKIKLILDGGNSKIGLESTVVDLSTAMIKILRPGAITKNQITRVLRKKIIIPKKYLLIKSPGILKKHYSPGIPIKLNQKTANSKTAFLVFGKKFKNEKNIFNLSKSGNLNEIAKNLYKMLRKAKELNYKKIHVYKIPKKGIGYAINDRLKKASY